MCALCVGWSDFSGNQFTKKQFERPRPFEVSALNTIQRSDAHGVSCVSNHAGNMFSFSIFVGLLLPGTLFPMVFIASFVAYSRVYNGVHYPSDILAGALLGVLWALLFVWLTRLILRKVQT